MPSRRMLVTGCTGFVGKSVLAHFRRRYPQGQIWAVSDRPQPEDLQVDEYRQVDMRRADDVRGMVAEAVPTDVVHLAGVIPPADFELFMEVNVIGSDNLFGSLAEFCPAGSVRVVQISSASVYGMISPDEIPVREDKIPKPITPYALSKSAQDAVGQAAWVSHGLPVVCARVFNLIGPGQSKNLVPMTFVRQLKETSRLQAGNTDSRRDFVDVRDVAYALEALLEKGKGGEVYNIASGQDVSIQQIIDELLKISGLNVSVEADDNRRRPNDVPVVRADISKITTETGWQPSITWRQSLADMWESYELNH